MKKDKPIIIAQIMGKWVGGGVEAVIMNYYRHIDKTKVQFDFICDSDSTNIPYEEIESLGGRVILCPPYQKLFKYIKFLTKLFKENKYTIIHSNINVLSVFPLYAAKKAHVPVRIAHSHSTSNKKEWKKNIVKNILRPFSKRYATDYFACSELAGRYMFGNKTFNEGKVTVINNAVDLNNFKFNKKYRKDLRKEFNIKDDAFVIGHIGRFVKQKNHDYLIDIFNEVHKSNKNTILLLIGQGPLNEEIKNKVDSLGLTDSVIFAGQRTDVNKLYSAMDMFLFPSLYEGLGMVLIEAQTNGLGCVVASTVPDLARISNKFYSLDLSEDVSVWSKNVFKCLESDREKIDLFNLDMFSIDVQVDSLKDIYINFNKGYKIELFGSPACGKSFYSQKIKYVENYNEKYIYCSNRLLRNVNKILLSLSLFIFNNNYFRKVVKFIKGLSKDYSIKKKLKMFLYMTSTIRICIKGNKSNRTVLIEEGIFQLIYGLSYNFNLSEKNIKGLVNDFKDILPNEVIYIKVSNKTLINRLNSRDNNGGSELEHDIKKDIKKLDYSNNYVELIKNLIIKNKKINFIEMDGE